MKSLVATTIFESEVGVNNYNNISSNSTTIGNETCFSYILIVDLLKQMPQTNKSKNLWLNKCREYHRGNEFALKQISDFSKEYKADDAIQWYTADAFVYKLVNRALRTEDITLWYLFRYFIVDMCKQIELVHQQQNYCENLTLYRGQSMSSKELESLRELINTNGLFCTTAFFSTSKDISVAKHFIGNIDEDNYQGVPILFEITVDSININTVTFVDIDQYFARKNDGVEKEFLFTIGSIFRITAVERDGEDSRIWKIYMKATDDGADIIQRQLDLMKNKYPNIKINLLFGRYLIDMNHLAKAKSYFQMLLHELDGLNYEQQYHEDLIFINNSLGELHIRTTNYKEAYQYFQTAYKIQSKYKIMTKLFTSYVFFGNYYKAIGDPLLAHKYYIDALRNMNENAERNKINIARLNINIASINAIYGNYHASLKLCSEAEDLLKKTESIYSSYSEMIICQGLIGDIYFMKQDYNKAEKFYSNAFHMCKQYLYIGHRQLIHSIRSLTELYRKTFNDNNQYAIHFCEKQLEQHRQHLSQNHLTVAHLLMKLGDIKQNISYYQEALDILIHNDYLEYVTIAQCYKFIGDYYSNNKINQNVKQAHENFCKTREIYREIYPENHHLINEIEDLINSNKQCST